MSDMIKCVMPHCDSPEDCEGAMRCLRAPQAGAPAWQGSTSKSGLMPERRCKAHIHCTDRLRCNKRGYCVDYCNAPKEVKCTRPSVGFGKCMNPSECGKATTCLHTKGKRPSDFYECFIADERRACVNPLVCEGMGSCKYRNGEVAAPRIEDMMHPNPVIPHGEAVFIAPDGQKRVLGKITNIQCTVNEDGGRPDAVAAMDEMVTLPEHGKGSLASYPEPWRPSIEAILRSPRAVDMGGTNEMPPPPVHESAKVISIMTGKPILAPVQDTGESPGERMAAALEVIDNFRAKVAAGEVVGFAAVGIGPDDEVLYWQSTTQRCSNLRIVGALQWAANQMSVGDPE